MQKNELLEELYTSRWYLSSVINNLEKNVDMDFDKIKSTLNEGNEHLIELVKKVNFENSFNKPIKGLKNFELFYPKAEKTTIGLKTRGKYSNDYPIGAIVHYTAGQFNKNKQSAIDTLTWAKQEGYTFMIIAYDGTVLQDTPLNEWGYHAGESNWNGLGSSVSNKLVGIEICNAGLLEKKGDKYYSWFNTEIPEDQVREIKTNNDNQVKGYFHKYSKAQEEALIELLVWLKNNNPTNFNVDYILGHDEVSGPKGIGYSRKQDPGGSLSMTMTELRNLVKSKI